MVITVKLKPKVPYITLVLFLCTFSTFIPEKKEAWDVSENKHNNGNSNQHWKDVHSIRIRDRIRDRNYRMEKMIINTD